MERKRKKGRKAKEKRVDMIAITKKRKSKNELNKEKTQK